MTIKTLLSTASLALLVGAMAGTAQAQIALGHLADYSGPTSDVGTPFGQGVADAFAYVNKNGGVNGKPVNVDTVDYGYQVPRAIAQYKKWSGGDKVAAILGWGTADTEALTGFLAEDKIPDISGSYAAALSDPTGAGGKAKPAPYNFFYGPSYSDAVRGMLTWAAEDWKAKGKSGKPKFVHMGANHPYPNAPKAAGAAIAAELGFDVLEPIVFALTPGDYSAQCLTLKSSGANYAYLGNTAGSNISVLNACKSAGVDVQFMGNVWGMDENAAKAAGAAADGVVFPLRTEGGRRMGRQEWRRHWRERQERLLPESRLGPGGNGRRLQSLDLDRERPPPDAQGRHLSYESIRCDRCGRRRSGQERHHQAGKGEDGRSAPQSRLARLVR
jgi:branched-chain amino acid transport system substrate-binding protein